MTELGVLLKLEKEDWMLSQHKQVWPRSQDRLATESTEDGEVDDECRTK